VNIVDEIADRAIRDRPAMIAGDLVWSFGQLLDAASEVARWLAALPAFQAGGTPRVGLACVSGADYIVLALGILKAGGCLVPMAEELAEAERSELVERTALQGMVLGPLEKWRRREVEAAHVHRSGAAWLPLESAPLDCEEAFQALNPAFIRFSSGTTGRSKGVVLSHHALRERILAANAGLAIGPADRVLWMLPMAHHFAVSIILYLYHGACTILSSSHYAEDVLHRAKTCGATVSYASPFHYSLLAAEQGNHPWTELRLAVSSAAPLSGAIAAAFLSRYGKPIVQGLGIIEVGLPILNVANALEAPTSIGLPQPDFEVEVRDESGRQLPPGQVGELWIKGPGMFDAYLSPWQLLERVSVEGWFATGDLAERDCAGLLFLRGRSKSVLNIGGMKVFPEEIEAVIQGHPAVSLCRVTGHAHPTLGAVPVAEVVLRPDRSATSAELVGWCRGQLSAFKIPAQMKIVAAVPLTASGKVRRA
jgi:long-chain acyl-CoA synthetase